MRNKFTLLDELTQLSRKAEYDLDLDAGLRGATRNDPGSGRPQSAGGECPVIIHSSPCAHQVRPPGGMCAWSGNARIDERTGLLTFSYVSNILGIQVIQTDIMTMRLETAATIMAQLGNETRLKIVRQLVKAGEDGMMVGELQAQLSIPASTLSHHISHLRHAGLLEQHREGTSLYCVMNYKTMDAAIRFLTEQCCANEKSNRAA